MPASYKEPHLIQFKKIGDPSIGYISVGQFDEIPFEPRRLFWAYFTPESVVRGRHAHHVTEQVLIAAAGRIVVNTENADGRMASFVLDNPTTGVYIPPNVWHTMQYSHNAVQVVLTSTFFDEQDYIRDHEAFLKAWSK